jgi:hypothetical protein
MSYRNNGIFVAQLRTCLPNNNRHGDICAWRKVTVVYLPVGKLLRGINDADKCRGFDAKCGDVDGRKAIDNKDLLT